MRGVHKWFGGFHALKGIDMEVAPGETVVVCGPSGSGKSTLIRCINGLERHDGGEVRVHGVPLDHDVRNLQAVRADVGMVFQQFNLFPHLTVLENLVLGPVWVKRIPRKEAVRMATASLERVRIADQAHKYPGQLSGGQQQRAAIARSLCRNPSLILFDEPTSALDPEMIKEVLEVMMELARSGITMMVVTHEMNFAQTVANRVVFMDDGRVVEENTPAAFFSRPETERGRLFLRQIL